MRAGRLKDKVSIQTKTISKNALQEDVEVWNNQPEVFRNCSIEPLNGKEFFAAQGESTEISARIRFRYESGLLTPAKRLVDVRDSTIYDITSVIDPGNEHKELICMCVVRDVA